ncbi:uncharacterized protein BKA55DRAFT_539733 [Fusarium redolens]|uniref:Uncharacterized protein n=1 Tax=Fusarium redolens TaxID=48865 RepID=A0A9P9H356_FUSRE|nr:uncharacterized protein BKA55DRAFT_539733 [Fusarium redolens]KAH7250171.1 hypothetical protein BKA55DRAFT_539733 [Fusarium redolens]
MIQPEDVARFSRTSLYRDIELGLHNLLIKRRNVLAPPHSSTAQRYYAVGEFFSRPPNSCWCDNSEPCTDGRYCWETPCPILGKDMNFKICDRDHFDGKGCTDRFCFNPNASARKYMLGFIAKRARQTPFEERLNPVAHGLVRKYSAKIASRGMEKFSQ